MKNFFLTDNEYKDFFFNFEGIRAKIIQSLIHYGLKKAQWILDFPSGHGLLAHEIILQNQTDSKKISLRSCSIPDSWCLVTDSQLSEGFTRFIAILINHLPFTRSIAHRGESINKRMALKQRYGAVSGFFY